MVKVTSQQAGIAIKEWSRKEKTKKILYWATILFSLFVGMKFYANETICIIGLYAFYRLASLGVIWAKNEYRYTMERRRLFLKILYGLEKRVAEDKPLW